MSPAQSSSAESGTDRFETLANELYGLPPGEFVAARDAQVKHALDSDERKLAAQLRKLRRPTQAAWLVNLLWRDQRGGVEEFLRLAQPLQEAQQRLAGAELRRLSQQRQQALSALLERARALGGAAGARVGADAIREVGNTLEAALADPDVAAEVQTGRLTQPASYAGFGPLVPAGVVGPATEQPPEAEPEEQPAGDTRVDKRAARKQADAVRQAAERRLTKAREEAQSTGQELAERERVLEETARQRDELRNRIDDLRRELDRLERQQPRADHDLHVATRQRDRAVAAHERTRRNLTAAEETLAGLD